MVRIFSFFYIFFFKYGQELSPVWKSGQKISCFFQDQPCILVICCNKAQAPQRAHTLFCEDEI